MERLTKRLAGTPLVKDGFFKNMSDYASICYGCTDIDGCVNKCGFYKALDRLAEYEDLGPSPEEIKELQDQVEVLTDTVNMLSPLMMENFELKKERIFISWEEEE